MASQRLRCPRCHERFARLQGSSRKYCERCSPPRPSKALAPVVLPAPAPREPGRVEAATRAELERVGRAETPDGVVALYLAGLLDGPGHTASGVASLARAHREAMAAAMAGAPPVADALDELTARRRERAASA